MALSPLELMRNSIVCFEGRTYKVKAISELILLEGRKEWIGGSLINGEPLSEEWLMKLGFQWEDTFYSKGKLSIILSDEGSYPKGRVYFNSWAIKEHQPEYVHQLQMLYFSLFLEHLTIPKLPK